MPDNEHHPYDKIIRENFKSLIPLILSKVLGIRYKEISEEPSRFARTKEREADFIFIITDEQHKRYVLHIEFQSTDDEIMDGRMLEYAGILYRKYNLQVHQYVIYIGRAKLKHMKGRVHLSDIFDFGYQIIYFEDISYKEFINSDLGEEIILAILCNYEQTDSREIVRKIMQNLKKITSPLLRAKYVRQLKLLAKLRKKENIVNEEEQAMIKTMEIDITKDNWYITGMEKGMEKGIEEGMEKGMERGEKYKAVKTAIKLLKMEMATIQICEITELTENEINLIKAYYEKFGDDIFSHINITARNITAL